VPRSRPGLAIEQEPGVILDDHTPAVATEVENEVMERALVENIISYHGALQVAVMIPQEGV
jgi:hypothetical protein